MAVDTPARIAILGAGPIGLEAALYARFLGYEVAIFERGRAAEHVRRWGHVTMFTPWRMNVTPLGLAALTAQDSAWKPQPPDARLTGRQWAESYLLPLAESDLLADGLHEQCDVLQVGREGFLPTDPSGEEDRDDSSFVLLVVDADGQERIERADVVIDAAGTWAAHQSLGAHGLPALGERHCGPDHGPIEQPAEYAGRRVLVVGAGHTAATDVCALAALKPRPTIHWVTRRSVLPGAGPIERILNDPLVARDDLARDANRLATSPGTGVEWRPGTWVERIAEDESSGLWQVKLIGDHEGKLEVDRVVADVGSRAMGPTHLALHVLPPLLAKTPADGPAALVQPETDLYILGVRSRPRGHFLLADGHRQIRDLFTIIGDRADLDLYRTIGERTLEPG